MSNHTPGPWTVPARDSGITVNAGNSIVAEVYAVDIGNTQMANAKLIAAAPTLFEALFNIANGNVLAGFEIASARAALAKAGL